MAAIESQQLFRRDTILRKTRDGVRHFGKLLPVSRRRSRDLDCLGEARPIKIPIEPTTRVKFAGF